MRLLLSLALALGLTVPAIAEEALPTEYTVEMWNQDPDDRSRRMVFSQEIISVAPGATVTWSATDRGHNVEFVAGPNGVDLPARSAIGRDFEHTFTKPGVYVYVCTPHATMGMIGVVVVGEATEEAVAAAGEARMRGSSQRKLAELLEQL